MVRAPLTSLSRLSRTRHDQLLKTIAEKTNFPDIQLSTFLTSGTSIADAVPQGYRQVLYAASVGANHDCVHRPASHPMNRVGTQKSMATPMLCTKRSLGHFAQNYFFGTLEIKSYLHLQQSDFNDRQSTGYSKAPFEDETSITFRPAEWLVKLGAKYGIHACMIRYSTQGWQHKLKMFCPVPDNSPIFQMCSIGNLTAVRDLLCGGHASVRDTDSLGRTPLHVSGLYSLYSQIVVLH